jgi:hypothetical protein
MTALLALAAMLVGLLAPALAMPRHHAQLLPGRPLPGVKRLVLRLIGASALLLGLPLSAMTWGWRIGPVAWFGLATAAILAIAFGLPLLQRLRRPPV